VVEAFADLIKMLWLGSSSSITPRAFKETVGEFATQFRGYDQHDSQEFMVVGGE
jgi:ubiquitin carboxyl-terminal hydrolase 11